MNLLKDYVTDIRNEFKGYNGKRFSKDLMAGITVAAVALPLALAFGVSSGATAAAGLVTAIIGGIIISIFSGASFQISGPTGAMIDLVKELEGHGTEVYLTSVQPKVLEEMRKGGLIDLIGEEYIFDSAEEAIIVAQKEHM